MSTSYRRFRATAYLVVCVNELKIENGKVPAFTSGAWVTET